MVMVMVMVMCMMCVHLVYSFVVIVFNSDAERKLYDPSVTLRIYISLVKVVRYHLVEAIVRPVRGDKLLAIKRGSKDTAIHVKFDDVELFVVDHFQRGEVSVKENGLLPLDDQEVAFLHPERGLDVSLSIDQLRLRLGPGPTFMTHLDE